ncbi:MAG: hypothetical protein HC834_02350 [Rhodospirillales bacterium]|nr:hypothetical protein [Rhodospirillales bacterium]
MDGSDPIQLHGGINRFGYVGDSPICRSVTNGNYGPPTRLTIAEKEELTKIPKGAVETADAIEFEDDVSDEDGAPDDPAEEEGYQGGLVGLGAEGTGVGPGTRPNNTDAKGNLPRGPSATSQRSLGESIVPVAGPFGDAVANIQDLGDAQSHGEAFKYGALAVANGAFAGLDIITLGRATQARAATDAALRANGIIRVYSGGEDIGKVALRNTARDVAEEGIEAVPKLMDEGAGAAQVAPRGAVRLDPAVVRESLLNARTELASAQQTLDSAVLKVEDVSGALSAGSGREKSTDPARRLTQQTFRA